MSLAALDGTPLIPIGHGGKDFGAGTSSALATAATLAVTNASVIMYGHIFTEDGASHTIDTTGFSSLGWRSGAVTFANAASVLRVGLAPVDTTNGPPGRASNTAGVTNFDVFRAYTTSVGPTTSAWNESVPTSGTKTIANGDVVAFVIQFITRAGADSVIVQAAGGGAVIGIAFPGVTTFDGTATYTGAFLIPTAVITFSDGTLGFFYGGYLASIGSTAQTWNSGSATKEYGNYLLLPFPTKVYGVYGSPNLTADSDFVLYSDPLGTPVAQKTVSMDSNVIRATGASNLSFFLFSSPYTTTASQPLAVIAKPGASNISLSYRTFNASAHQKSLGCGVNGYAVNRASGAFAAQNSNKDRFDLGILVGAFDNAVDPTGGRARAFSGFA